VTLQPAEQIAPDVELILTGYLRTALTARTEPYAAGVRVSNSKVGNTARQVVVRRDGGPQRGVLDYPRLGVRVWADVEQEASDLARLVQALLLDAPGTGGIVAARSMSGPTGIPDESQPQKYLTVELIIRCTDL
jgi:hypothetical protein